MNLTATLILWGCLLPALPIQYFSLRNECKFKKSLVVGVTLPYAAREDAEITARLERFRRELGLVSLALGLAVVPGLFIRSASYALFVWGLWLLALLILPYVPYVRCNRDLRAIKEKRGWRNRAVTAPAARTVSLVRPPSFRSFLPALLLTLAPVLWEPDLYLVYIISSLLVLACRAGYRWLTPATDADSADHAALTRRYRGRIWLLCAYFLAATALLMSFFPRQPRPSLFLLLGLTALMLGACTFMEFRLRQRQEKLSAESGQGRYPDEDDKWIWGLFYYNPNDSRFIISARLGINTTVNLARSGGWAVMAILAAMLLVLPFTGFLIEGGTGRGIDFSYEDAVLTVSHGAKSYAAADIRRVELREELPEGLVRIMGTGTPDLLKGKFRAAEEGDLTLCLDPNCPPFLLVETEEMTYLFGARDEETAEGIYREITGKLFT